VPESKERTVLRACSGDLDSAEFSPNGSYIVTASSSDRAVKLWSTASGHEMAALASPNESGGVRPGLTRAAFNSDGTRIVILSGVEDPRVIRVFPTPQELIDFARSMVPRQLTPCERQRYFLPVKGDVGECAE
jgi:WD40 repeat protein